MVNACVVGYGAVGPVHAAAINASDYANLYAVCDVDEKKVNECVKKYGCRSYLDFDVLLKDEFVNTVHICTPHFLHKEMCIKALRAGKNVVLEKPVALNFQELMEVMEVFESRKGKQHVCVMLQNRTNECIVKAYDILKNDPSAGKLLGMIASLNWKRNEAYYGQDEWRGKWATEGGGLMINQAVHMIDLMCYFGGDIEEIHTDIKRWNIKGIEVEDTACAFIKFKTGARGVFHGTNCYISDEPFYMEFKFENRHLRYADGCLYDIKEDGCRILARDKSVKIGKGYWGCGHHTVIDNFYSTLSGEYKTYSDLQDAYNTMMAVYSFYSSNEEL